MRELTLLVGVFLLQHWLETLFLRSFGDFFLALGLYLALKNRPPGRAGLLLLTGLWEGYFRSPGIFSGLLAASAVFWAQRFLEKHLNLESPGPLVFTLLFSLFLFQAFFFILIPYLLERGLPALWWRAFFWQNLLTTLALLLIVAIGERGR